MTHETGKILISWTPEKLTLLKRRLKAAEADGKEVINVEGYPILVTYGKYLAEYLTTEFAKMATH
jgi:hypothetical protein